MICRQPAREHGATKICAGLVSGAEMFSSTTSSAFSGWRGVAFLVGPPAVAAMAALALIDYSYLLFHSLIELAPVTVSLMMAVIAYGTMALRRDDFFLTLAAGFFWIGLIDILHILAFDGMGVFPVAGPNLATQFWIAGRLAEAALLGIAAWRLGRTVPAWLPVGLGGVVFIALISTIMSGTFPDAYIAPDGMTPFKINAEYVVIGVLILAWLGLWRGRKRLEPSIFWLMSGAILLTALSEAFFTTYLAVTDGANATGHIIRFVSTWLVLCALVWTVLDRPLTFFSGRLGDLDLMPNVVLLIDKQGKVRGMNEMARRRFGHSVLGLQFSEAFPQVRLDALAQAETAWSSKDRHYLVSAFPMQEGGLRGTVVVARDATEEVAAQRAKDANERFYRDVLHTANAAMVVLDTSGAVVDVNTATETLLGRTRDEILGNNWIELAIPHCVRVQVLEEFKKLKRSTDSVPSAYENLIVEKSGTERHISWRNSVISAANGEPLLISFGVDVTDLRESERRFKAIFHASPVPMTLSTFEDGKYLDVNPAFERVIGFARDEILGRTAADLHIWVDDQFSEDMARQLHDNRQADGLKGRYRKADGQIGYTQGGAALSKIAGKICVIGAFQDITSEEHAMQSLRATKRHLEKSNQELLRFAEAAAHDLREPARQAAIQADLLSRHLRSDDPEVLADLDAVKAAAKRMYRLVGDLLRYTELGVMPPEPEAVALDQVVRQAVRDAEQVTGRSAAFLISDLPVVMVGRRRVPMLFQEILKNALAAAAPDRPLMIEVREGSKKNDGLVYVEVSDTGTGFDPVFEKQAFDLFRRLGRADPEHSGIGLPLARRIAELNGGKISIESSPGIGTKVTVGLPEVPQD